MNFSMIEIQTAKIRDVSVSSDTLIVDLADGRTVSVPLAWYPRLLYGEQSERDNWHLIGKGEGIHWSDLDEDISVENILLGKPSGESQRSLKRWIERRTISCTPKVELTGNFPKSPRTVLADAIIGA